MAKILDEAKSNIGGPYVFYTVYANEVANSRTVDSVKVRVQVDTHLQYSASYLGGGYPLTGYINLNGVDRSIAIKGSGDSWSGTTVHTQTQTITVTGLTSSATSLTNVKFKVSSKNGNDSGELSSRSCSNIAITMGHLPPSINSYTIIEQNQDLIDVGIGNNVIVDNLSQKQVTLAYELHDGATATKFGIYNGIKPYLFDNNPFVLDFSTLSLDKTNDKINIKYALRDSLGSQTLTDDILYTNIPYTKINFTNNTTIAKRIGQLSGKVGLNINGIIYNSVIGNVDQTSYKPTIKYTFWEYGTYSLTSDITFKANKIYYTYDGSDYIEATVTEGASVTSNTYYVFGSDTYSYTIPSENISSSNNIFSVSNYNIGSTNTSDSNYFDPEKAYRIKIYVEDNFTNAESAELQIAKGYAVWSEYSDRVDFDRLTRKGNDLLGGKVLYEGNDSTPTEKSITLSDSAANYDYLEIFYIVYANQYRMYYSVKVDEPNGKTVGLFGAFDNGTRLYEETASYSVSGTSLTRGSSARWRFGVGENQTRTDTTTNDPSVWITKVIGYK